jgi:CSLREA domain-containing protein
MMQQTINRVAGIRVLALGALLAALVAIMMLAAKPAHASTTFTVNSTEDNSDALLTGGVCDTGYKVPGPGGAMVAECTLRAAIQQANFTTGADTIEFDIPTTGVATIAPASGLPKITGPVSINGYSQPGASPNTKAVGSDAVLKIHLSGGKTSGTDALVIGASNSTVKGLVINGWQGMGVRIDGAGATSNRISGNFIGTDASGATVPGNYVGVRVFDGSDNTIGGTTAAARNLISGNGDDGISIYGGGNRIAATTSAPTPRERGTWATADPACTSPPRQTTRSAARPPRSAT